MLLNLQINCLELMLDHIMDHKSSKLDNLNNLTISCPQDQERTTFLHPRQLSLLLNRILSISKLMIPNDMKVLLVQGASPAIDVNDAIYFVDTS